MILVLTVTRVLTKSIDDTHKGPGKLKNRTEMTLRDAKCLLVIYIVGDVQHGALLPGVDQAVTPTGQAQQGEGGGRVGASEGSS